MKIFKRILSYLMMIMMVVFLFSGVRVKDVSASEIFETSNGYLLYSITANNEIIIINYSGTDKELYIPNEIEGKVVTSIGNYAFTCRSLASITIPDSVKSIGDGAFSSCSNLTSITIPDSVKSIGNRAFESCSNLTSITIPNSVTSIGNHAFYECKSLIEVILSNSITSIEESTFDYCTSLTSIIIPNSVKSIGYCAFYRCESLSNVIIPNSVKSIEQSAFYNCSSLKNITIPESVETIGVQAFIYCDSLTSITIPKSVERIGTNAFMGCDGLISINVDQNNKNYTDIGGVLFNKDKDKLITYPSSKVEKVYMIPNSVTNIEKSAFYNCKNLASIKIPNTVKSIGNSAFFGCSNLTNITIPNTVKSIGDYELFGNCSSLTSITLPNTATSIGYCEFYGCKNLVSIIIPNSVTSIENDAFYGCSNLKSITIPNSVTSIENDAFLWCSGFTIYGYKDSYAENYTKEKRIPFKEITNSNLSITSFISDKTSPQVSGTAVTLTAKTSGEIGTVEYKYYRYLNGNYDLIKDWSNNSSITITPSIAGKYDIYVAVKDSSGTIVRKNIEFEFKKVLAIDSFTTDKTSPQPVNTEVTLKTNVSGVTGTAQYKYYKYLNGSYSLIKDWSNNSSTTIAPSTAGKYDLWVGVKDESGKTVRKNIEFEFKKELEINSFIADKASPQSVNTEVTLKTNVSGETGTVEYKYYRYLNGNYALIKDWSNNSSITIAPSTVGTYDLWVAVKDSTGKIVRKSMKYIIKEQKLKVDSFTIDKISPQEIGTSIKLTAQASGGKGTLQYKFRVGDKDGNYLVIQKFSTSNTATWSADYSGDVILYVDVEDESGRGVTKAINYTIKEK